MSYDYKDILEKRNYPEDVIFVKHQIAAQKTDYSCGPAACRNGLLLNGLNPVERAFRALMGTTKDGTGEDEMVEALRKLGFETEQINLKKNKNTADRNKKIENFLKIFENQDVCFIIICIKNLAHWVCIGDIKDGLIRIIDSHNDKNLLELGIYGCSIDGLVNQIMWDKEAIVVKPGVWLEQYQEWLPAREKLLRRPSSDFSIDNFETTIKDSVEKFLNNDDYAYANADFSGTYGFKASIKAHAIDENNAYGVEKHKNAFVITELRPDIKRRHLAFNSKHISAFLLR